MTDKTIMVSGGFDPIHAGHVRLIEEASHFGAVIVALNSNEWLIRKKGYYHMEYWERHEILEAMEHVALVVPVDDSDGTVCQALELHKPDFFANGGDRLKHNVPELDVCEELGIEPVWNCGGGKVNHSSDVVWVDKPWGRFRMLGQGSDWWAKFIEVNPGERTSLQRHFSRTEYWVFLDNGHAEKVELEEPHRLANTGSKPMRLIEVAIGEPDEQDIIRLDDDYGRVGKYGGTT